MITVVTLGPITARMMRTRSRPGNAIWMSTKRMMTEFVRPPL